MAKKAKGDGHGEMSAERAALAVIGGWSGAETARAQRAPLPEHRGRA